MIGANLVLGCQITTCEAEEIIELGELVPVTDAMGLFALGDALESDWPEGWGWDSAGVNRFLHCPEHRG